MAALLRRWASPWVMGVGIWLLSVPLVTSHLAPVRVSSAGHMPAPDGHNRFPSQTVLASPTQVVGQLAVQPAVVLGDRFAPFVNHPPAPVTPSQAGPAVKMNWISIARLGLSQPVGWYTDCLGQAPVPRWGTWRWNCAGANNTYILAHNPGVFTPILGLQPGDVVDYGDPGGAVHAYRVTMTTIVSNTRLWPLDATAVPSLTLQTCWTWDGSRDFIVRAVQI